MALAGYKMTNNAQGSLSVGISASATSVILQSGQGGLFPATFPFLAKIEHPNSGNSQVLKREIVKVTNRSGDVMTIVRAWEACPLSDSATTQQQTPQSFSTNDSFSHVMTAWQLADIEGAVGDAATATAVQNQSHVYAVDTGTATGYIITPTPSVTTYTAGMRFSFKATNWNSGSTTLTVGTGPAVSIKKTGGSSLLSTGDIVAGQIVSVEYDGAFWQMQSPVGPGATVEADGETISAIAGETITAGDGIGAVFLGTGALDTYLITQQTGAVDLAFGDADARTRIALSLTPDATEKINALRYFEFQLRKVGNPTDVVEVRLLDSAKAVVSGWITASFSGAALSSSYITYRVTQNATLTNGQKYYLEFRRQTANDAANYYHILGHSANINTGYGFATYTLSNTTWSADSANDAVYTVQYGFTTVPGQVYTSDSRYLPTAYSDGIAVTSGVAGENIKIRSDGLVSTNGILAGYSYYLNAIRTGTFIGGQQITSTAALSGASSNNSSGNNLSNVGVYESFITPSVAVDITSVKLKADYSLTIDGAYPAFTGGSVTLKIYQDNGSNAPWTLIATGTTGAFSGTGSNTTITVPIVAGLAPLTKYWLEANASCMSPTPAITNTITFRGTTTNSSTYSEYATRNPQTSGAFTLDNTKDLYFELVFNGTNTSLNNTDKTYNYKSLNGSYGTNPATIQYLIGKGVTSTKINLLTKSSNAKSLGTEIFGDGSDGDVTIAGTVTLTRDMYYRNLVIPTGTTLDPAGYSVYVQGSVTGSGTINRNGNAGGSATVNGGTGAPQIGGVAGTTLNQGSLNAERAGGSGGNGGNGGNGSNGTTPESSNPSYVSVNGVTGANGSLFNGGVMGAVAGGTATRGPLYNVIYNSLVKLYQIFASATTVAGGSNVVYPTTAYGQYKSIPGNSGGAPGGSPNTGNNYGGGGGGAGGNGGMSRWFVNIWNFTGTVTAIGGTGGNGGNSVGTGYAGAGGTGGNGGVFLLFYRLLVSLGTVTLTGGAGGSRGAGNLGSTQNGNPWNNGVLMTMQI